MKITAYKCEETGRLFESKQEYLEHLDDLKKKTQEAVKQALEDEQILAICDAPRTHAKDLPHLETLLHASLNALNAYPRLRILKATGVDLTAALEKRTSSYPLMSERFPEKFSETKPASGMEFKGVLKAFQAARPPGGTHPFQTMFPYLNLTDGGGTRHSNGQWVETWGVTLCLDDFPVMRTAAERLLELRAIRNQRLSTLSQQQELLESESVELNRASVGCTMVVEQIRMLEERLRALQDQQQTIRESISQELQARYPDDHLEERQALEIGIPLGRPHRGT